MSTRRRAYARSARIRRQWSTIAAPPWPSSSTTISSLPGHARWSRHGASSGLLTSRRPWISQPGIPAEPVGVGDDLVRAEPRVVAPAVGDLPGEAEPERGVVVARVRCRARGRRHVGVLPPAPRHRCRLADRRVGVHQQGVVGVDEAHAAQLLGDVVAELACHSAGKNRPACTVSQSMSSAVPVLTAARTTAVTRSG